MLFRIMAGLLMLTQTYAPFIHMGANNHHGRAIEHSHPDTFGLWASVDGVLTVTQGDAPTLQLPGPVAVFIVPGERQIVAASAGSRWYGLRFDVVAQPRRRLLPERAWRHDGPVSQPSPQAVWGCELATVVPVSLCRATIQLLRDCCALWWRNDHFHAQANAVLGHWLMDYVVLTRSQAEIQATGDGLQQRCRELIQERLSIGADVADLAAACGYSRVHFMRHFKATTGMTPGSFLRQERMANACHRLASTDETVQEVAEQCGYRSVSAFSRAFTDWHGITPGCWRRKYR